MPSTPFAIPRVGLLRLRGGRLLVGATLCAAVALAGCGAPKAPSGGTSSDSGAAITRLDPSERKAAPRVEGKDLDGNAVSLAGMRGKVVVVNIWGSWCPPCRKEQPVLTKVSTEFKDRGVEFLGIAIREGTATSKAYAERNKVPYPSISDPGGTLLLGFASSLPAVAVPTTYVIDRQGRVATRLLDVATEATLSSLVTEIVEEP